MICKFKSIWQEILITCTCKSSITKCLEENIPCYGSLIFCRFIYTIYNTGKVKQTHIQCQGKVNKKSL